ncbi:hypothetical protein AAKU55_002828 [Oxalobacteraceae bacterium GrIS 1.11]
MKNAPTTNSNESAPDKRDFTPGILPHRVNTVTAGVLAYMLEGRTTTGMESVLKQSTTRLAAFIHRLSRAYGWPMERTSIAVGTKDGRETWVASYWLSQATIAAAFEVGARGWIEQVKEASASRRKQARKCKTSAAQKNAARRQLRKQDPRQGGLWGDQ